MDSGKSNLKRPNGDATEKRLQSLAELSNFAAKSQWPRAARTGCDDSYSAETAAEEATQTRLGELLGKSA